MKVKTIKKAANMRDEINYDSSTMSPEKTISRIAVIYHIQAVFGTVSDTLSVLREYAEDHDGNVLTPEEARFIIANTAAYLGSIGDTMKEIYNWDVRSSASKPKKKRKMRSKK